MQLLRTAPLLLALISTAYQSTCRSSAGAGPAPGGGSATDTDVTLPGVETGSLTGREKKEWSSWVSELLAPCSSEPVSIAQCVKESRKCSKCVPAARLLVKQVRDGRSRSQAEEAFFARFSPDRVRSVDVSDSPSRGPSSAPVNIAEFADFECPHCRHAAPVLEKLVEDYPGKVRFVFKFYPLSGHVHGESAARAAVAAMKQNKFWQMHHTLFEHQDALEPRDIEKYAKDIGLDMGKFKADWDLEATADRVSRDRKQGDQLSINGTPAIYINGREYDLTKFDMQDDLNDWIKLEIELANGAPGAGDGAKGAASGGGTNAPVDAGATSERAAAKKP
jgi:thiol-disulfide isomerase/thioredoxin